mmetsp:Transcript_52290/g.97225  ORF Transcript_52290/g.97225 Transcript_52290/m.97225 type:complete len:333 (-) Transcript_52290:199-1197(-)
MFSSHRTASAAPAATDTFTVKALPSSPPPPPPAPLPSADFLLELVLAFFCRRRQWRLSPSARLLSRSSLARSNPACALAKSASASSLLPSAVSFAASNAANSGALARSVEDASTCRCSKSFASFANTPASLKFLSAAAAFFAASTCGSFSAQSAASTRIDSSFCCSPSTSLLALKASASATTKTARRPSSSTPLPLRSPPPLVSLLLSPLPSPEPVVVVAESALASKSSPCRISSSAVAAPTSATNSARKDSFWLASSSPLSRLAWCARTSREKDSNSRTHSCSERTMITSRSEMRCSCRLNLLRTVSTASSDFASFALISCLAPSARSSSA